MYAEQRIKVMPCFCKVCKRIICICIDIYIWMAVETIGNHLMANRRHHSFRRWRGMGVRDKSDIEWDNHVHINVGLFP